MFSDGRDRDEGGLDRSGQRLAQRAATLRRGGDLA